jgi:hypothetical protein
MLVIMLEVVFVVVPVIVIVIVIVAGLLVPHPPRMTRKTPCSTSTPAILALLQKPRTPNPLQRPGRRGRESGSRPRAPRERPADNDSRRSDE